MDSYWDGRKIVYDNLPKRPALIPIEAVAQPVKRIKVVKPEAPQVKRIRLPKGNVPIGWESREIQDFGEAIAVQYSENRKATASLMRAFNAQLAARPKPGKDGSIRSVGQKMAIAAWRNARVMGKPSAGTARLDFLDLDLAARRQLRREMLGRVRIG